MCRDSILPNLGFGKKVREGMPYLVVWVDGVVPHSKAFIDTTTGAFRQQDFQILVFVDGIQFVVDPLATELVLDTKALVPVSLTAKPDDVITLPLFFEETVGSLIISSIFCGVSMRKPVLLIHFKCDF